jgi:hypothetical protein
VIDEKIKLPISARWRDGSHFRITAVDTDVVVEIAPAGLLAAGQAMAYGGVV